MNLSPGEPKDFGGKYDPSRRAPPGSVRALFTGMGIKTEACDGAARGLSIPLIDATEQSRRIWVLTIRRFAEMAWARHGATRYASVVLIPVLVGFAVPGLWWALCALFTLAALIIDQRTRGFFDRLIPDLDRHSEDELRALVKRQIAALAAITTLYAIPYGALAFAPHPGPVLGVLFCAGAALVCATLHVMTRSMILHTIPAIAIGLVANAAALAGGGVMSILAGALAALLAFNAIVSARGGAASFGDLIVARLKAEEAAEELEARVEERTSQLAIATKRAQEANRAKSAFLANMSHELRTPLNAIIGYTEIVEEDLASGDTASSTADLTRVRSSAAHLLTLINEVLDLSRIEAGRLELSLADLDLHAILREAIDTVLPAASKNNTRCVLRIDEEVPLVLADETRLRQCVLNLLSNAAKFTRDGLIVVHARAAKIGSGAGVAIAVRDTGRGISAEDLRQLFRPFVQADASSTRAHGGAGLGLVITRRLARAMGGDVVAASELAKGSTFTLFIPASAACAGPRRLIALTRSSVSNRVRNDADLLGNEKVQTGRRPVRNPLRLLPSGPDRVGGAAVRRLPAGAGIA